MQIKDLSADLILTNGCFCTLDSESSVARAVAIKDGRIVAVGGAAAVGELTGPATRQLDLNGRAVIPGIFDSHNYPIEDKAIRLPDPPMAEHLKPLLTMYRTRDRL